jgi:2-keto-4-pentenoate hydratase
MTAAEALARLLLEARQSGRRIEALPTELIPATAAAAYEVQALVAARLGSIAGWKVGAASPTAEITCAPLFASLVAPSPARFLARQFPLGGIEGELAFRLGRALPPRAEAYGEDEVWAAVATLAGVEMGLAVAGVPHKKGGVEVAMDYLAGNAGAARR